VVPEALGAKVHLTHPVYEQQRSLDGRVIEFARNELVRTELADLQQQTTIFGLLQPLAPHRDRLRWRRRLRTDAIAGNRNEPVTPVTQTVGIVPIDCSERSISLLEVIPPLQHIPVPLQDRYVQIVFEILYAVARELEIGEPWHAGNATVKVGMQVMKEAGMLFVFDGRQAAPRNRTGIERDHL
jgi:hypothetical protein